MIQVNVEHAEKLQQIFEATPKEAKIILWRSINRAATAVRTRSSVTIRQNYIIKAEDVKKRINIRSATIKNLTAQVRASGPVTPLMKFDVSPKMPDIARVTARVKKSGSRKSIENGFVVRTGNGHVNVFTRVGKSRYPIQGRYGPSVAQMMGKDEIAENILERGKQVLDDRLTHELSRLLRGS